MPAARRFAQIDVFTRQPLMGNPVAVVLEGDGLETAQMQAMAAWTNLSETTFVLTPKNRHPARWSARPAMCRRAGGGARRIGRPVVPPAAAPL